MELKRLDIRSFKAPHQPLQKVIHAYPFDKIPSHIRKKYGLWNDTDSEYWFIVRDKRLSTDPNHRNHKVVYKNVGATVFRKLKLTKFEDCELYYKNNHCCPTCQHKINTGTW